ncbi:MAG: carbohydrate ABC transporter permease [Mycobacteriales bacterium]
MASVTATPTIAPTPLRARKKGTRWARFVEHVVAHAVLIVISIVFFVPFFWMVVGSVKTLGDWARVPVVWFPHTITFENYIYGLRVFPFGRYLFNTVILCGSTMIGAVLSSSFIAYGLARIEFPGRTAIFVTLLSTMMVPYFVTMVPLFTLFRSMGWTGTYAPLIVPTFFGVPFFVFLLRQFFRSIPSELTEAARIDGANELRIYWQVILPLAKPALAAVALFQYLFMWNDLLGPLIYISNSDRYTLAVGLMFFKNQYSTSIGPMMAASTAMVLPVIIVFFLAQRYFIQGITLTGVKG